jgi:hypothetical protein
LHDTIQKLKDFESRLKHVCFGLLEVHHSHVLSDWYVEFVRKSARDYLDQPEILNGILAKTKSRGLDVTVSLLSSYLLSIKAWNLAPDDADGTSSDFEPLWRLVEYVMILAGLSEISTGQSQDRLLDEVDRMVQCHVDTEIVNQIRKHGESHSAWGYPHHRPLSAFQNAHWCEFYSINSYRSWARLVSSLGGNNFVRCVQAKLNHKSELLRKAGRPLLDYAVEKLVCEKEWLPAMRSRELVRFLLCNGADPNETYDGWSPWKHALYHFEKHYLSTSTREKIQIFGNILEEMIKYGADPNAICEIRDEYFLRPNLKNPYAEERKEYRYSPLRVVRIVCPSTDPNENDSRYWMAIDVTLRLAVKRSSKRLSELLVARGGQEKECHDDNLVYPKIVQDEDICSGDERQWLKRELLSGSPSENLSR